MLLEKVGSIGISISFGYEIKCNAGDKIQDVFNKAEGYMYKNKLHMRQNMKIKSISNAVMK